jgi:hypothetical protein
MPAALLLPLFSSAGAIFFHCRNFSKFMIRRLPQITSIYCPQIWLRFQISDQAIFEMQPLATLKILRPKKFEIWGKDVGMVWKLFMEGA